LLLGQAALGRGNADIALEQFRLAMEIPENLGEAYHLLQAKADVNYWTGRALRDLGREAEAMACFEESAAEAGDFQAMAVTEHSELSYFRGLSLVELGRGDDAKALFESLYAFAEKEMESEAKIDYFATSLPLLVVFEDDLDEVKRRRAAHLLRLAKEGLSRQKVMQ
jgi:tetratricopeptide (TPR) repeat protein